MKKKDYQRGRKMIREDMKRLVIRYLEEIIRYKEELAGIDFSKIEKPKEATEEQQIRNAKLLALLEIQEIANQMIKQLNALKISEPRPPEKGEDEYKRSSRAKN